MAVVLRFPEPVIDLDRVRLDSDEPCLVLVLPVMRIEREETREQRERRFLYRVLGEEAPR